MNDTAAEVNNASTLSVQAAAPPPFLRRFLLAILLAEMLGVTTELLLSDHTESLLQWIPLVVMTAAGLTLGVWTLVRQPIVLRLFQLMMFLFILSGAAGIVLHYNAKAEFQRESDPSLSGLELFWDSIRTTSPPALAPGAMIQMGLLGFAVAYRHPGLKKKKQDE